MKKAYISPLSETRSISAEGIIATSDMTINSNTPTGDTNAETATDNQFTKGNSLWDTEW